MAPLMNDITNRHEKHFKAVDQKIDDIPNQLARMLQVNKVHFAKKLMEQKFATAVDLSEQLIHPTYNHRLAAGALHQEGLLEIVNYVNEMAEKSIMFCFINEPSDLFLVETSYINHPEENILVFILHAPLVSPHNLMPLIKFIPMLVHFNFSCNVSVTRMSASIT
jgi:hypothetical protein